MWVSGFKNACWNHITRHPSKIRGNSLFMVSKHGCNFKNIWRGRSRAAVSLKAIQQRWMFVWKASHCSAAVYSYILYASGLVSWHKFSLANIFLHSDQPSTTALAFHLYYHLPHPRLGTILYKQDQNCSNWLKRTVNVRLTHFERTDKWTYCIATRLTATD